MSDDGSLPEPDPTVGAPIINVDSPLLEAHAIQFALRQRFLEAMREAVEILRDVETIDPPGAAKAIIERAQAILEEALDPEAIEAWKEAGYPLRSIPPEVEARGAVIDRLVAEVAVDARYNVWAYDSQYDDWSLLYDSLNYDEAQEQLDLREASGREGIEYIMLPVGQEPRISLQ